MDGVRYSRIDYEIGDVLRAAGTFVAAYPDSQVSPKVGTALGPVRGADVHVEGFVHPGSRTGESAFLFGSSVGVRPNPRARLDAGVSYLF